MSEACMEQIKDMLISFDNLLSDIAASSMGLLSKRVLMIHITNHVIQHILELELDGSCELV